MKVENEAEDPDNPVVPDDLGRTPTLDGGRYLVRIASTLVLLLYSLTDFL